MFETRTWVLGCPDDWSRHNDWRRYFSFSGVALELTGPAEIFAYLIAGVICIITASNAAELATSMLQMAQFISAGNKEPGIVEGMHFIYVPYQTPISTIREKLEQRPSIQRKIDAILEQSSQAATHISDKYKGVLKQTDFRSVTDAAHNVFGAMISETQSRGGYAVDGLARRL